jgi:L-aspartate oxidase
MRYIGGDISEYTKIIKIDVVVIGSGLSGLYTALNIDSDKKVAVLTKSSIPNTNSDLAQGGIAAAVSEEDSPALHKEDTMTAGAGLCDEDAVDVLVNEAAINIKRLVEIGVPFDRTEEGVLALTKEGGHRQFRVIHASGDATGHSVLHTLIEETKKRDNITCYEDTFLVDIVTNDNNKCCGVLAIQGNDVLYYQSPHVCIATGGMGQVYRYTTNPYVATGDGVAAAWRAGAEITNMEFIQFHPTVFTSKKGRNFLISEALRGEGAILRNYQGYRFMKNYHPMADLAPRDIVARAMKSEMDKDASPHLYLDITHKSAQFLEERFPTIYKECLKNDIDISNQWIPVAPAQHYLMGGIKTDLTGKTTISGLYACGECSWTGVHGANRLASNSLLECLVFGRRIALEINKNEKKEVEVQLCSSEEEKTEIRRDFNLSRCSYLMKKYMTRYVSIERNEKDLLKVKDILDHWYTDVNNKELRRIEEMELFNMITLSQLIVKGALDRKDSIGSHYRND